MNVVCWNGRTCRWSVESCADRECVGFESRLKWTQVTGFTMGAFTGLFPIRGFGCRKTTSGVQMAIPVFGLKTAPFADPRVIRSIASPPPKFADRRSSSPGALAHRTNIKLEGARRPPSSGCFSTHLSDPRPSCSAAWVDKDKLGQRNFYKKRTPSRCQAKSPCIPQEGRATRSPSRSWRAISLLVIIAEARLGW